MRPCGLKGALVCRDSLRYGVLEAFIAAHQGASPSSPLPLSLSKLWVPLTSWLRWRIIAMKEEEERGGAKRKGKEEGEA